MSLYGKTLSLVLYRFLLAQLVSCLDHMKEVLGEAVPEKVMVEAVLNSKFDVHQALDSILAQDHIQNMKTKNEETAIVGKAMKGMFRFNFAAI